MQSTSPRINWRCILALLLVIPGGAIAGPPIPADYVTSKPLLLEIRYCTCVAIKAGDLPSGLLPGFLQTSKVLKVGVLREDKGFVSSRNFTMGYELNPLKDAAGKFRFRYVGEYVENSDTTSGNAELVITEGQWISLFRSDPANTNDSQYIGVAVRLKHSG